MNLTKHADLDDPESVKEYIAKKDCENSQKTNLVKAYNYYAAANGIKMDKATVDSMGSGDIHILNVIIFLFSQFFP